MSKTIVFFGNERLATGIGTSAPILQALVSSDYTVRALIISQDEKPKNRSSNDQEVVRIANSRDINVYNFRKLSDELDVIKGLGADIAVLVAYGKIIPQSVIDIFPYGIVNIHPSLLPKHRGPTPLESVLLEGSKQTGVSLMKLVSKMDAGPVYAQQTVSIKPNITKQALADQLGLVGRDLLMQSLASILNKTLTPSQQEDSFATYDSLIKKDSGSITQITLASKSALELERQIRAYSGWPRSRTMAGNTEIVIMEAHTRIGSGAPGTIWRQAKEFGFFTNKDILVIDQLIPVGKKEMSASAFLAGYKLTG